MAKDPAFLFYPGDYLRDTQCFSENTQVAYDRIMCEHMRNICITQKQLNFFTKKLSIDEKEELEHTLTVTKDGFCIEWVAESIVKRRAYSESRRKNRTKDMLNTCKSYDTHMENENENENENKNENKAESKDNYFEANIPESWKHTEMYESWKEWVDFRKEIKKKLTLSSAKKQIVFLQSQPDPKKCIDKSILNGWQGLFEYEEQNKKQQSTWEKNQEFIEKEKNHG